MLSKINLVLIITEIVNINSSPVNKRHTAHQDRKKLECYFSGENYSVQIYPSDWSKIYCYAKDVSDPQCMYGYYNFTEQKEESLLIAGCGNFVHCAQQTAYVSSLFKQYRPKARNITFKATCCKQSLCNVLETPHQEAYSRRVVNTSTLIYFIISVAWFIIIFFIGIYDCIKK